MEKGYAHGPLKGIVMIFVVVSMVIAGCPPGKKYPPIKPPEVRDTTLGSYNLMLGPGATPAEVSKGVARFREYMDSTFKAYMTTNGVWLEPKYEIHYCPCDSNLVNLDVHLLAGVGTTYPPPPPPPKGGSGDEPPYYSIDFKIIRDSIPENGQQLPQAGVVDLVETKVDRKNVIAVIDTGLDSLYFIHRPANWIWSEGSTTLYNTLPGAPKDNLVDDHKFKHGTAVSGLILSMMQHRFIPRLMILKALDSEKEGSTFTVSCALSYAIQKKVTAVNLSLGYGAPLVHDDPVMKTYITRCERANITMFAAAGNVPINPGERRVDGVCEPRNAQDFTNLLTPERGFFPASYSESMPHLISVTGLRSPDMACGNQNYSNRFVKVGLLNKTSCCTYKLPFFPNGVRGSSFATPMIAGVFMDRAITDPGTDLLQFMDGIVLHEPRSNATVNGVFVMVSQR